MRIPSEFEYLFKNHGKTLSCTKFIPSDNFVARIRHFYVTATEHNSPDDSLWNLSRETMADKIETHHILSTGSLDDIKQLLSDPCSTDLFYGADNACKSITTLAKRDWNIHWLCWYIISNGIELGLLKPSSDIPYYYDNKVSLHSSDFELVIQKLENCYPENTFLWKKYFYGECGFSLNSDRLYCFRSVNAFLHSIYSINILKSLSLNQIIEIGPGLGRTLINIFNHKIKCFGIDLPLTLVGQALYIAAALGESCVSLGSENDNYSDASIIHLLTPELLPRIVNSQSFILNIDSFTEMGQEQAINYANIILKHSKCLLSINHENNLFTVNDVFRYKGVRPVSRTKDIWFPYMKELYIFNN